MAYDEISRQLVLSLKHGDRLDPVRAYATLMLQAGTDLIKDADVVVPVPLHWTRLFRRRYNQSALLSTHVAKLAGLPHIPDALRRLRRTEVQASLPRKDRLRNVRDAFEVAPHWKARLEGRTVLVIDDVLTTGATVENCADSLYKAGAQQVDVLTLARVVQPGQAGA